jgi:hypothetical protein
MGDGKNPYKNSQGDNPIWIGVLVVGLGLYYLSLAILRRIVNPLTPLYTQSGCLHFGAAAGLS